jgi:hypothetical protein
LPISQIPVAEPAAGDCRCQATIKQDWIARVA